MGRLRTNIKAPELIKKYPNYCDLDNFNFPKKIIYLEIGSGKGDFLIQQAINNPKVFFLGIEKYSTVVLKSLKKIIIKNLIIKNLCFSCYDAQNINLTKFKHKINKIYLNFSDPWPKKRHEKRRLTSPHFIDLYKILLVKNGEIEFKTDNDYLYQYTLNVLMTRKDINIIYKTNNLYYNLDNVYNVNNVPTEYEKKFVSINKNINKVIWTYNYD